MPKQSDVTSGAGQTTKYLHVSGMHCASCATIIERKLSKIPEVAEAHVSFANHQAMVVLSRRLSVDRLLDTVQQAGYQAQVQQEDGEDLVQRERAEELSYLRTRLIVAAVLTGVLLLTMVPGIPMLLMNPWFQWAVATPVQFWVGRRFYQGAWAALKAGGATMDTLVVLGTSVAYGYSAVAVLFADSLRSAGVEPHLYFEAAAAIITFVLLGKFLELRGRGKTAEALESLLSLHPTTAHRILKSGKIEDIDIDHVSAGDRLLVKAGEQVPVDGKIVKSTAVIDESMVTGESIPVTKTVGQQVLGATVNTSGSFEMVAERVGADMFLSQVIAAVRHAQASRPRVQQLVDKISSYFVPGVLVLALLTFIVWWLVGPEPSWLYGLVSMTAVLIIACPCALGLATPVALIAGVGRAAKAGILIKDASSLESAEKIKTVLFDKTGTITEGRPTVTEVAFASGVSEAEQRTISQELLTLESQSQHPLAVAIVEHLQNISPLEASNMSEMSERAGQGVEAKFGARRVQMGTDVWFEVEKIKLDPKLLERATKLRSQGQTVIQAAVNGKHVAFVGLSDTIRPGAAEVVRELKKAGYGVQLISGDTEQTVAAVAKRLGIAAYRAAVLPAEKETVVKDLVAVGEQVAFVGDGINDAPALARADLGIAMGTGTDVARGAAEIVLLHSDIRLVPQALKVATATLSIIRQNLFWAFAYNVTLIPVAMGVLYPFFGIQLQPMFAGAAMALSSVTVVLNALRLQRIRLGQESEQS